MRILTIILGAVLIIVGIYCFFNLGAAFLSLALIFGIIMLIYGIGQLVLYFSSRNDNGVTGWVLADGIITSLLGLVIIFFPFTSEYVLLIWFAVWLLFSGIMRIVGAFQIKPYLPGAPWVLMLILGILSLVIGVIGLIYPMVTGVFMAVLLGIFFILQGINCILLGASVPSGKVQPAT